MDTLAKSKFRSGTESENTARAWAGFLQNQNFDSSEIKEILFGDFAPVIYDLQGNKFSISFTNDKQNYHKRKSTIKSELIGRAMGSGRYGLKVLDLSAGLAIDAIFLAQLGFEVTAIERNPLIFLALEAAAKQLDPSLKIKFIFESAFRFLETSKEDFDVIFFDPMFPEKTKSALPRQEMVFFRHLVGADLDAEEVLRAALSYRSVERIVVKRPLKAPALYKKPHSNVEGKLIRFDIYGAER